MTKSQYFLLSVCGLPLLATSSLRAATLLDQSFTGIDGGFTVENSAPAPTGPWIYTSASGAWSANGGTGVVTSILKSNVINVTGSGPVTLSFDHRYSLEPEWDGGVVRVSINGAAPALLALSAFTSNGYNLADPLGNYTIDAYESVPVFNGVSAGFDAGQFLTSTVSIGVLSPGNTLQIQWVGLWDEESVNPSPNWDITKVLVTQVPEASTASVLLLAGAMAGFNRRRKSA